MKVKHIFAAISLSIALGAGAFAGFALNNKEVKPVEAASGQTYYLVGETKAGGTSQIGWTTDSTTHPVVDGGDEVTIPFEKDDEFKFVLPGTWDNSLGSAELLGSASSYFSGKDGTSNILCKVTGEYKVKIKDSKVYLNCTLAATTYVQLQHYENTYVYAFDETTTEGIVLEPLGGWPGTKVSDFTIGVNFAAGYGAGGGIAKMVVPYIRLSNTKIIVNDGTGGEGHQSGNCILYNNYYYWDDRNEGDNTKGLSAKAVYEMAKLIEKAENQSACNVTAAAAQEVLNANSTMLTYSFVKTSTLYTWKDTSRTEKADFTFEEVIALLQEIAAGGSPARKMQLDLVNNTSALLIIVISVSAVAASGLVFFYIRKRRLEK